MTKHDPARVARALEAAERRVCQLCLKRLPGTRLWLVRKPDGAPGTHVALEVCPKCAQPWMKVSKH